ncbi:MAG TPA: hypothetical protein VNC50_19715 [Planctomycetia bacterium]|nr:hypothetical protein [Planctomycetia bacterium]
MPLNFAAQVTPLSPAAQAIGLALGAGTMFAAAYLLFRHRRDQVQAEEDRAAGDIAWPRLRWRTPIAWLLFALGGLVVAGCLVDPAVHPRGFVLVWAAALLALFFVSLGAGLDLLAVRRRALESKLLLVRENRRALIAELQAQAEANRDDDEDDLDDDDDDPPPREGGFKNGFR